MEESATMNRKAQITVFIIIGLAVLTLFGILFYMKGSVLWGDNTPKDMKPLKVFIEQCVKDSAEYSTYLIGIQGGMINLDEDHFEDSYLKASYVYTDRVNLPSTTLMQNELAAEISRNIKPCLNNFADFPQFNITDGIPKADVKFTMDKIFVDVKFPITVKSMSTEVSWQDFSTELDVRMLTLLANIEGLLQKVAEDKESFDALYIDNMGMKTYILPFEEAYVYVFEDTSSVLKNEPYLFMAAVKR